MSSSPTRPSSTEPNPPPAALRARLDAPGPKRLLALDGGGIRGLITLGYLRRIESELRRRYGRPDLVLADYFDLVGGTSTGSMIATAVALGWTVDQVHELYMGLARDVFKPRRSVMGPLARLVGAKFDERAAGTGASRTSRRGAPRLRTPADGTGRGRQASRYGLGLAPDQPPRQPVLRYEPAPEALGDPSGFIGRAHLLCPPTTRKLGQRSERDVRRRRRQHAREPGAATVHGCQFGGLRTRLAHG